MKNETMAERSLIYFLYALLFPIIAISVKAETYKPVCAVSEAGASLIRVLVFENLCK